MSLLFFSFVMVYIIHKIFVFHKNHLNYLNEYIFECLFQKYNFLNYSKLSIINIIFFKKLIFSITYNDGKSEA